MFLCNLLLTMWIYARKPRQPHVVLCFPTGCVVNYIGCHDIAPVTSSTFRWLKIFFNLQKLHQSLFLADIHFLFALLGFPPFIIYWSICQSKLYFVKLVVSFLFHLFILNPKYIVQQKGTDWPYCSNAFRGDCIYTTGYPFSHTPSVLSNPVLPWPFLFLAHIRISQQVVRTALFCSGFMWSCTLYPVNICCVDAFEGSHCALFLSLSRCVCLH